LTAWLCDRSDPVSEIHWPLHTFEKIPDLTLQVTAQAVDGVQVYATRCLVVEKRDGVALIIQRTSILTERAQNNLKFTLHDNLTMIQRNNLMGVQRET
jgi:hypothetical protein